MAHVFISRRHRMRAAIGLAAVLVAGAMAATANARDEHWDHRDRDRGHGWRGGYYAPPAPPAYYYPPYSYAAPPIVYGPGLGLSVNIR